ncbi:MAG: hypothetical protein JWO74_4297 [Solirubrobacterales bacterium]|nr:hypothetical protein [Solirubrobacterales bacterium]
MSYEDAPTLRPRLREILAAALAGRYGEEAVDPGAAVVLPSAEVLRRIGALGHIALPGRRVLDLTDGIADLARAARAAGADLVDVVMPDEDRLRIARMLCVLQDVQRVSFFEGDAALASTYADEYDVILAFGQLGCIAPILPRIAQNLRGVLVTDLADGDRHGAEALAETLPARETLLPSGDGSPPTVACAADAERLNDYLAPTAASAA